MPPWNAGYRHARLQTNHQRYIRNRDYSVHNIYIYIHTRSTGTWCLSISVSSYKIRSARAWGHHHITQAVQFCLNPMLWFPFRNTSFECVECVDFFLLRVAFQNFKLEIKASQLLASLGQEPACAAREIPGHGKQHKLSHLWSTDPIKSKSDLSESIFANHQQGCSQRG